MKNNKHIPLMFALGAAVGAALLLISVSSTGLSNAALTEIHTTDSQASNAPVHKQEQSRFEHVAKRALRQPQAIARAHAHPSIGKIVKFTPPPLNDFSGLSLPRSQADRVILSKTTGGLGDGQLELDENRRDALTGLGLCTRWIVKCVDPNNRSLDDCTRSVPQCTNDEPWLKNEECCPATCFDQYAILRESGQDPIETFDQVYFSDASCFPGVQDLLDHP